MPQTRLGLDTYSIRSLRWNITQLLDYAAAQKLDAVQASIGNFESTAPEYLGKAKEQARRLNLLLEPGFGCISTASRSWNADRQMGTPAKYLEDAIRVTKTLEARNMRVFLGGPADRIGGVKPEAFIETTVTALRAVRTRALDAGVKIALENHGEAHSRHLKTIIQQTGADYVGVCYDSGNPVLTAEDPMAVLENLAPHVVTSHIRDSAVYAHPQGAAVQWVALGDGSIDMHALATRFHQLCPEAPFQLEIITGRAPTVIPFLEDSFWQTDRTVPSSSLARFLAVMKTGRPFSGAMIIPGANGPREYAAALREQERYDLERSFAYARQLPPIGLQR